MKITKSIVTKLVISEAPALDPITVYAEDIGPRQGKITIECWGKAWSANWGGMGERSIAKFFSDEHQDYLAGYLSNGMASSIFDPDAVKNSAKAMICKDRRRCELSADDARERSMKSTALTLTMIRGTSQQKYCSRFTAMNGGTACRKSLPEKPNPDYQYLCRIITAVQQALRPIADGVAA